MVHVMFRLAVICGVCSATCASAQAGSLRFATFNIHAGYPLGGHSPDLGGICSDITTANADVVVLQEVHQGTGLSGCVDQPAALAALLSSTYPYSVFDAELVGTNNIFTCGGATFRIGLMTFSKFPLSNHSTAIIDPNPGGTVIAQTNAITKQGMSFQIYNTHFSTCCSDVIRQEYEGLRSMMDSTAGDRVVMAAGDFNFDLFDKPTFYAAMTSRPLFTNGTYEYHNPGMDHVWSDWPPQGAATILPIGASDHSLVFWEWSWGGDSWITVSGRNKTAFGMNGRPSSAQSGNIYARSASGLQRTPKTGNTWSSVLPYNFAAQSISVVPTADPFNSCEFVAYGDGHFRWALESGIGCPLGPLHVSATTIAGAPAVASFARPAWVGVFPFIFLITLQNYFVFTTQATTGYLYWTRYEGSALDPADSDWAPWSIRNDGWAWFGSSPAAISHTGGRVDIFTRDGNQQLDTRTVTYDGATVTWGPWNYLGMPGNYLVASNPGVASKGPNSMDVCILAAPNPPAGGTVYCKAFNGAWPSPPNSTFRSCGAPPGGVFGVPPGGAFGTPGVTTNGTDVFVYLSDYHSRIWVRRCN